MGADIIALPTRARSFYTVRKAKGGWAVQLVTPAPGRPLRTTLVSASDRDEAIAYGRDAAARTQRPFKIGRAG